MSYFLPKYGDPDKGGIVVKFEPRHDKTNRVSVRPAKTQISLGIRPVWSRVYAVRMKKPESECASSDDSDQPGHPPSLIWSLRCTHEETLGP